MNQLVNDNLFETRAKLVKEIASSDDAQFNRKPDYDTWSIAQVCHHLVLVEESSIKAIAWGMKREKQTQAERKNVLLILDRKQKIKAPEIVEPSAESFKVQQIIALLNESRKKLTTLLQSIGDKSLLKVKSVKHPALGDLPLDQWIEQIYLHEQRHIEQIKELKLLLDI